MKKNTFIKNIRLSFFILSFFIMNQAFSSERIVNIAASDFAGTMGEKKIYSDSGVFGLGVDDLVTPKCIRFNEAYRRVDGGGDDGLGSNCPNATASIRSIRSLQVQNNPLEFFITRNLGVDSTQAKPNPRPWMRIRNYTTDDYLEWQFLTHNNNFPSAMKVNIPGSGIHTQVGMFYGPNSTLTN